MTGPIDDNKSTGLPRQPMRKGSWFDNREQHRRGVVWQVHPNGDDGFDIELLGPTNLPKWLEGDWHTYGESHAHISLSKRGTYRTFSKALAPKKTCPFMGTKLSPRRRVDAAIKPAIHSVNKTWVELHRARGYMTMQGASLLAMELEVMAAYVRRHGHTPSEDDSQQTFWGPHPMGRSAGWVWGTDLEADSEE